MQYDGRALELDKVLKMVAEETACPDARAAALALEPSSSYPEVCRRLEETDGAFVLMAKYGAPSFGGLSDVRNALRRAQAGGALNLTEFLRIAAVLRTLRAIVEWRSRSAGIKTALDRRFDRVAPNKYLEERIDSVVVSEEEVADTASPRLHDIRRKIRNASARAREQLDKMVRSPHYQRFLQEPIVTQRSGRFVVPVKAECRSEIPGLVHDTSSSGATVFVEPIGVVEANNEVRVLESEEKAEIEQILTLLSAETGTFADPILEGYDAAVALNVIFAKASLGYRMKAVTPKLNETGKTVLHCARHPLLAKETVVPTEISLGDTFDTLVITGPNTGGKTVALKTIGLFTLMAMCGLMVPAAENSELSVFSRVYANIGDEQSIEQSLSTFSSHMTSIIHMLETVDEKSLVLLDELGAGTDPVEGAALAMAILETLREKGARVAATTHYAELKEYALQTPGVENACCEFDVATLRPTYKLLIGVPGRSNAFAISERLGMDLRIVERARELVSLEDTRFEDVVEKLEKNRKELEQEHAAAEQYRLEAQRASEEAKALIAKAEADAKKELERARNDAAMLVSRTRGQVDALLDEMEQLRRRQNQAATQEEKAKLRAGLRELEKSADPVTKRREDAYTLPRALRPGDSVLIYDIDKKATVVSVSKDGMSAEVQAGIIKTRVDVRNLRLLKEKTAKLPKPQRTVTRSVSPSRPMTEVDLRGMTVEEALLDVDRAIDAAMLSGVGQITFIHGKGTGVLRSAVQQHLKIHPAIRKFRLGTYGEGESGVTIAELA
ncbi:endonuclease MutS2 [Yeguia hominis]